MTKKPKIDNIDKPEVNVSRETSKRFKSKSRRTKKRTGILGRVLYGLIIIVVFSLGLGLIFHQSITNKVVESYATEYVSNTTPEQMKANEEAEVSFDPSNVGALTSADVLAELTASFNDSVSGGVAESGSEGSVGNNHYTNLPVIGAIAIPDLGVNLPVLKGLDNASLAVGAGTMKPGQQMGKGNYSLASHSLFYGWGYEKLLFSPLHYAKTGQVIYTRDSDNIYIYRISEIFIVNPEDGYVVLDSEGDGLITLITCTDTNALQRIVVRGKFEQQLPIKDAWPELIDYFGSDWNRYW